MFVVRQSSHIFQDLTRQWSSWNFGQDGFFGTYDELQEYLNSADYENPVYISGFELYENDRTLQYGELCPGYWVVIDQDYSNSLACNVIKADTLEQAIELVSTGQIIPGGDGDRVDTADAVVVWSMGDIHILEIA